MKLDEIVGQPLLLVMVKEVPEDEDEWGFLTTAVKKTEEGFFLDMGEKREAVPFPDGLEEQIVPTPQALEKVAGRAELCILLRAEEMEAPESLEGAVPLGIVWPDAV